ncbi:MAG TPA: CDP-glucose 4,6-dehydratase [Verrucomicrobiae bacterium]|jgi:CDP-glucose 4,6-dehydratase|nr:CDP-glucose 4,6-dehydratase [Verrucomicrobiae bacterium]
MTLFGSAFTGKRVLVTGHTGFKGAWLCEWLLGLGAHVTGLSLPPETEPSLFSELGLNRRVRHVVGDIQEPAVLTKIVNKSEPDFVFHLAAQALVRESYVRPRETFNVNGMGTLHLLEALRNLKKPCAAVFITTDKCYENREWHHGYREEDALGGRDPYSASKAVAELIIASYRNSFFQNHPVKIASSRAGNVIGGGDWAKDRIIPDCIDALQKKKAIAVRNRHATRPWQHVLEPLSGYLWLAASLAEPKLRRCGLPLLASAFNFGPNRDSNRTVAELVEEVLKHWPGRWQDQTDPNAPHEAGLLQLSTDKAYALLRWFPIWSFSEAIGETVDWYRDAQHLKGAKEFQKQTQAQIAEYIESARAARAPWTTVT